MPDRSDVGHRGVPDSSINDQADRLSPKTLARLAGVLYIAGALGPVLAIFIRSSIIEPGNAAATADSIRASEALLRAGIAIGLVSLAAWPFAVMILYRLLRHGGQLTRFLTEWTIWADKVVTF